MIISRFLEAIINRLKYDYEYSDLEIEFNDLSIRVPRNTNLYIQIKYDEKIMKSDITIPYTPKDTYAVWNTKLILKSIVLYISPRGKIKSKNIKICIKDSKHDNKTIGILKLDIRTLYISNGGLEGSFKLFECSDPAACASIRFRLIHSKIPNTQIKPFFCFTLIRNNKKHLETESDILNKRLNEYSNILKKKEIETKNLAKSINMLTSQNEQLKNTLDQQLDELNTSRSLNMEYANSFNSRNNTNKGIENKLVLAKVEIAELKAYIDRLSMVKLASNETKDISGHKKSAHKKKNFSKIKALYHL